jgi:hypothetical protein
MNWAFTSEAPTARMCIGLFYMLLLLPGTLTAQHPPPSAVVKKSVNLIQVTQLIELGLTSNDKRASRPRLVGRVPWGSPPLTVIVNWPPQVRDTLRVPTNGVLSRASGNGEVPIHQLSEGVNRRE